MTQGNPKMTTKIRKLIISCLLLLLVLVALYVSIARQLVVWVSDYKFHLQNKLSETLHTPVTIGELKGSWDIFSPTLTAYNVHIGDHEQKLEVDQLTLEIDVPQTILNWQVRIATAHGENLKLQIRENKPDIWSIGGIPRQKDPITPEIVLSQLQRFTKISISNSTISVHPYNYPTRTFTHVNATLTHFTDERMRLDGILYINDDKPLILSTTASIAPENWQNLKGTLYADIPYLDWHTWLPKEIELPQQLKKLTLGGQVWANIKNGQLRSATIDTKNSQLVVQHEKNQTVAIKDITMQAWFDAYRQEYIGLQVKGLSFTIGKTPFTDLDLLLTRRTIDDQQQWNAQANSINIEHFIPPVLALAPLSKDIQEAINTVSPKGIIQNVNIKWLPEKPLIDSLSFIADVKDISFNPYKDTVGAGSITGKIQGGINNGHLDLDADNFSLFIAKVYSKPWHYQHAKTTLNWSFDGDTVSIFSHLMQLKGDEGDLVGDMMIRLYPYDGIKDYMDLRVNIANGDASYTSKYIPSKANIDPELVHWLNTSIKSGDIETGFFQYQGSLDKRTPSTAHSLLLYMKPKNAEINYQAPWLPIKQVDGEVFVEPSGVRILADKGVISNSQLTDININIPHVANPGITHLYLNAKIVSTLDDTLQVLKSAPSEISYVFNDWQGTGNLTGNLQLDIPLKKHHQPIVITSFSTKGAQLNLQHPIPPLTNISGSFHYDSTKGLSSQAVTAYALGNPVTGSIIAKGTHGEPLSYMKLKGNIDISKLASWYIAPNKTWPFFGKTPYDLEIWIGENNQLKVSSDLKGIAIDLPAPFTKAAQQEQNFTYQMDFSKQQNTQLQFNYNSVLTAAITMDENQQNWQGELLINQGKASFSNKKGLQVRGNLSQVNLEEWQKLYDKYLSNYTSNQNNKITSVNTNTLRSIDLRIGQVTGFNLPSQQAALYLQPTGEQGWRLDIDSPSIAGRITAPQVNNLPYYVHLRYLKVPKTLVTSLKEKDPINNFSTDNIPNVNLFIHQLFLDDDLIGTINFKNNTSKKGLKVSNIALNLKGLHVHGDLDWQIGKQTAFNGTLSGKNLEDILTSWDIKPTITAKSFKVAINGSWLGTPADFAPEHFTGTLAPELKSGRLLSVDGSSTNILRIFGILNSEAISRRLRLDFTDLYKAGLAYDSIKGEFKGNNGVLQIDKPFSFEGPSMIMSMTGHINMQNQQVDANLRVGVPLGSNISIATLAVAPPVGGAMLIVDYFLGNELMKLVAVNYSIKGNWNNPTITLGSH